MQMNYRGMKRSSTAFETGLHPKCLVRKMSLETRWLFAEHHFVNLYWCNIAGSESPPLFMTTDKPERPPSKELRRIKSFMQGPKKRPPMLSRRAASLMQYSLDDLSLDGHLGNFECKSVLFLLYETIAVQLSRKFLTLTFLRDEKCG